MKDKRHTTTLLKDIEIWSEKYDFSFQFWGKGNMNVYIYKDHVEMTSMGGLDTIREILLWAVKWCERVNPVKRRQP